jgi:hypothetical protein
VLRYRREEDPDTKIGGPFRKIGGPFRSDLAAGTEEIYRAYVRAGDRRMDLLEFPSAEEAERYAHEIRAIIAEA